MASQYINNLSHLNDTHVQLQLDRLPTLGEILSNKTKSPVDLMTFYQFMRDVEHQVNYIDFWFDLINHSNLCKHYVKGLRESIVGHSTFEQSLNLKKFRNSSQSKHKSLSSSILLDLIINDNVLQDNDSNRLSQFLRGDISMDHLDPKLQEVLHQYQISHQNEPQAPHSPKLPGSPKLLPEGTSPNSTFSQQFSSQPSPKIPFEKRVSSHSRLLDDDANVSFDRSSTDLLQGTGEKVQTPQRQQSLNRSYSIPQIRDFVEPPKRMSIINPEFLERLIRDSLALSQHSSFVNRENLKDSSHNLLLKYFVQDAEKNLHLPQEMNEHVIKCIEADGRDDPDVFQHVKQFVFYRMESDHFPRFLNFMAIRNINHTNFVRIIVGFFFLFIGFWISFIFVFLSYRKSLRPVIILPYLIAFYCLISSIYLIDPILCWLGYSESFSKSPDRSSIIRVREKFVYKLLLKRSLWVLSLILVCTAILTVIFSLVPGHRL